VPIYRLGKGLEGAGSSATRQKPDVTFEAFREFCETRPRVVANIAICLIHQPTTCGTSKSAAGAGFVKEGGIASA